MVNNTEKHVFALEPRQSAVLEAYVVARREFAEGWLEGCVRDISLVHFGIFNQNEEYKQQKTIPHSRTV